MGLLQREGGVVVRVVVGRAVEFDDRAATSRAHGRGHRPAAGGRRPALGQIAWTIFSPEPDTRAPLSRGTARRRVPWLWARDSAGPGEAAPPRAPIPWRRPLRTHASPRPARPPRDRTPARSQGAGSRRARARAACWVSSEWPCRR